MSVIKLTTLEGLTPELAEDCLEKACGGKILAKGCGGKKDQMEKAEDADDKGDDELEKAEDADDEPPDFDEDEFEDTDEYKAFAPLVLQAYKFWLGGVKGDKEAKKGYEWAKPKKGERPKEFAERVADHLENTKEGKDVREIVGDGNDYYDFVESIMYYSDLNKKDIAKSLYDDGAFAAILSEAETDDMEKSLSTGMSGRLSDEEAVEIAKIQLRSKARWYKKDIDRYEEHENREQKEYHHPDVPTYWTKPQEPADWVDDQVEQIINDIVWATKQDYNLCLFLKIARHLEGIPQLEAFIRQNLWEFLRQFDVIDTVPVAN